MRKLLHQLLEEPTIQSSVEQCLVSHERALIQEAYKAIIAEADEAYDRVNNRAFAYMSPCHVKDYASAMWPFVLRIASLLKCGQAVF